MARRKTILRGLKLKIGDADVSVEIYDFDKKGKPERNVVINKKVVEKPKRNKK